MNGVTVPLVKFGDRSLGTLLLVCGCHLERVLRGGSLSAQPRREPTCKLAHALFKHCAVDENLHPTRKQISETDRLASSAVARVRLVRVALLPEKIPGVECRERRLWGLVC